jgi:hypothetical protein
MKIPLESFPLGAAPTCPCCLKVLDGATGPAGERPKAGDLTVCAYCTAVLAYTEGLGLRIFTEAERAALSPEEKETIARTIIVVAKIRAARLGMGP